MLRSVNIRRLVKCPQYSYSTVSPANANLKLSTDEKKSPEKSEPTDGFTQSKMVAAAFASLKNISKGPKPIDSFKEEISSAKDVNSVLSFADRPYLNRQNALMIITILTNWAHEGKVKLSDFELDQRFVKVCRILGRSRNGNNNEMADLSVVLGVTADEQAAKLISSISLPHMVKILKSLGMKKRRSTPLLRSLSYNISNSPEQLNVKEASDVLYTLAELNYPDEVLLVKVREDLRNCLADNEIPSVICSAIKSLGLMRYRDTALLDDLIQWIMKRHFSLGIKDLLPLLFTLASVNYVPEMFPRLFKVLEPHLYEHKMIDISKFIDTAWSLIILQHYNDRIINSVMDPAFISRLAAKYGSEENINVSEKIHLLQINYAAKLLAGSYKGHLLEENSALHQIPLTRRKDKQIMVDSVKDTISNVVSNLDEYVEVDVNTNMGFFIDLVCYVDKKSTLVKINSNETNTDVKKIAIMICDYHDYCRGGENELTGSTAVQHRLLSGLGYLVLTIPHTEYGCKDVLMNRVSYINEKIKTLITES